MSTMTVGSACLFQLQSFHDIVAALGRLGYDEITWTEAIGLPQNEDDFALKLAFVIINSGMRFTVARGIFERVKRALLADKSASTAFKHAGKTQAIDRLWNERATYYALFLHAPNKIEFLGRLPWVGPITKHHAARNFGVDTVKPDIHLDRLSKALGTTPILLCGQLATHTGLRIGTIDAVLWRACALGLLDSSTAELRLDRMDAARAARDREAAASASANA